jgi:hypothetical protein
MNNIESTTIYIEVNDIFCNARAAHPVAEHRRQAVWPGICAIVAELPERVALLMGGIQRDSAATELQSQPCTLNNYALTRIVLRSMRMGPDGVNGTWPRTKLRPKAPPIMQRPMLA